METNFVVHVGVILKEHLETLGMTQKELCERIDVSPTIINELIKCKRKMNVSLANKLENVFGLPAKYWMAIQTDYDLSEKSANVKHFITGNDLLKAGYSAQNIADRFICYEKTECESNQYYEPSLTNLKLQKLLYFAQKAAIEKGIILFDESIKHWEYGPVVPTVYNRYKSTKEVIREPVSENELSEDIEKLLRKVYEKYQKYTASYLVKLSHREKAWLNTTSNETITPELIRDSLN